MSHSPMMLLEALARSQLAGRAAMRTDPHTNANRGSWAAATIFTGYWRTNALPFVKLPRFPRCPWGLRRPTVCAPTGIIPTRHRERVLTFIYRRAVPAELPGGHVASVRPWSSAPHIVDTAVGHDTDTHDTEIGREDPTVAPPVPGRWRPAAKMRPERAGLSAHLRTEQSRAQ